MPRRFVRVPAPLVPASIASAPGHAPRAVGVVRGGAVTARVAGGAIRKRVAGAIKRRSAALPSGASKARAPPKPQSLRPSPKAPRASTTKSRAGRAPTPKAKVARAPTPSKAKTAGAPTPKAKAARAPTPCKAQPASQPTPEAKASAPAQVYVLELEGGFVYVGKAFDVPRRLADHMRGLGASFTKAHRPTGRLLPRLGTLQGSGDGPERDETLRQMLRRGAKNVRGWKYCNSGQHSKRDLRDIETNIRELLDLCRRCGREGHFATGCRLTTDRMGAAIRSWARGPRGRAR